MDTVRVAPREISDVVTRCCRVRGVDPGVAQQIGVKVMEAHLRDGTSLDAFAAVARNGDPTTFSATPQLGASAGSVTDAYQFGVAVNAATWDDVYEMSQAFLVSAELLDSFVDEDE